MLPVVTARIIGGEGAGGAVQVHPGAIFELVVGEQLVIDGAREQVVLSATEPGHISRVVQDLAGGMHRVAALACEPEALERIRKHVAAQVRISGGDASPERSRRILRSLATHCERFDGTAERLSGVNLQHYGG